MCRIMDLDAVLLVPDLLIEIGGQAIAIGDQAFQDRDAPFLVGYLAFHLVGPRIIQSLRFACT